MSFSNERERERVLKALANRRRLLILRVLKKRTEATVGEIAEEINLSFKSTSRHLATLLAAELVEREQRSLEAYYRIAEEIPKAIRPIIALA